MAIIDLTKLQALLFDFDGVLTDNKVYVSEDGKETVRCDRSDGMAFEVFNRLRLPVFIVSKEKNKVVAARAGKLQIPVFHGVDNKLEAVTAMAKEKGFALSDILFVGNDLNDLDVMRASGQSACPSDSHPRIREIATFVLESKGGEGVAREVAEKLLGIDIAAVLRSRT